MLEYFLAFLLISSHYQSLGKPIEQPVKISDSLNNLAEKCGNLFLVNAIKSRSEDCAIPVINSSLDSNNQIRCLIFYDINQQLCSALSASKLSLPEDYKLKTVENDDISTVCTLAKSWNFTNLTEYVDYKNISEKLLKSPVTCGNICGVENKVNEVNDFCQYYKWGIEMLTAPSIPTGNNVDKNSIDAPVISKPESNQQADIPVSIKNNLLISQTGNAIVQSKQTKVPLPKPDNKEVIDDTVSKSTLPTSKQLLTQDNRNIEKEDNVDVNVEAPKSAIEEPGVETNDQAKKSTATQQKSDVQNDPQLPAKDLINIDQKDVVLENNDAKGVNEPDDYAGADEVDDDEVQVPIKNLSPEKQEPQIKTKLPSQNGDIGAQKDYYPNSDGFSDDGDNFFPFFLSAVIVIVLLYVLYHNKNKVSKVFFGLILEGRQGSRRRNSRGHAYRRLDTLEQAMSASTAAPPSKIIY